jgi:hypothetical protein
LRRRLAALARVARRTLLSGPQPRLSVEQLARDVEVAGMARGLLDHVQDDSAQVGDLIAERTGVTSPWRR